VFPVTFISETGSSLFGRITDRALENVSSASSEGLCVYTFSVYIFIMKSAEVMAALRADGWFEVATRGSHVQFKHAVKRGRVTVPHPKRDIPIGTLKSIEKQSGLKLG
jgi:predicted RNA binding protein YcfA (HicA-like mRNA interferase family)